MVNDEQCASSCQTEIDPYRFVKALTTCIKYNILMEKKSRKLRKLVISNTRNFNIANLKYLQNSDLNHAKYIYIYI